MCYPERLQLLCCGGPLSALLLRLATIVDHSGRPSIQHMHAVCITKRRPQAVGHASEQCVIIILTTIGAHMVGDDTVVVMSHNNSLSEKRNTTK
jgi:hypothetical protein